MQSLIKINLQLFAEDPPEIDINDIEIDTEGSEIDEGQEDGDGIGNDDGEETDETGDESQEEANQEKEVKQERMVPLSALQAEREKYKKRLKDPELIAAQEIAKRLKLSTGKDSESIIKEMDEIQVQRHIEDGMDPEKAKVFVEQERRIKDIEFKLGQQQRDIEFKEMSATIPEAEDLREDIEEYAYAKGLSVKEAYWAMYGPQKIQDMERQIEQRVLNNLAKKQGKRIDTTTNGEQKATTRVKLSTDELAIAKMAGMTPEQYYNMAKVNSVDQYRKTKKG